MNSHKSKLLRELHNILGFLVRGKKRYLFSAIFFTALLISIAYLTVISMQEAYDYRNQDVIIDEISDNLNRLAYFLNEYSFNGSIDVKQLNTVEHIIGDNITTLMDYHSNAMPLFMQMQNSFLQLKPLLLLMTTPSNALNGTAIWNSVFMLIDSMQSNTSSFSNTVNGQLGQAASNIQLLLISLVASMIAFFAILYLQIFGLTLKETEQFEKNAHSLQLKNEALENLATQRSKQLKDAERMATIGQTAGMVGHDIRNPLQAIVGDVYLLRAEFEAKPECNTITAQESFTSIETNIAYINKIVADLQDYARPLKPEYSDVDVSEVIASVFKTIVIPDDIKLSIDIKGFPRIKTDPTFIRRALTNLVNNAIQAMDNGGVLEVSGFQEGNDVVISVSDTGQGIPEEVKSSIFQPMVTTKAKGQGFGLAVVKRLVEAQNGIITFESQEGKGTKFTIQLPIAQ